MGLFKKGFGGREVQWAGTWDVVIDPTLYRLRSAVAMARSVIPGTTRMSEARLMGLGELTDVIGPERVVGVPVGEIAAIAYDSRHVVAGTLFFAVPGVHVDGHDFIADAVARGATAVVVEHEMPDLAVPQLIVVRTRDALADAADAWYGRPSERLEVIGVTGTDGKTTTCYLAVAALRGGRAQARHDRHGGGAGWGRGAPER